MLRMTRSGKPSLRATIDGRSCAFAQGTMVLQALRQAGSDVPHLCHDDRLNPHGACRLCVVEIEGQPRPLASCATPLAEGMVIRTRTPQLEALRKTNLSLMVEGYPADAVKREPEHAFHRLLARYGVEPGGERAESVFRDATHPYLGLDMQRCIHCQRCVRICDEVQGQFVWGVWSRGQATRIAPRRGATLLEGGCVSCGACADSCPSGALYDRRSAPPGATRWTRTTCVYCAVGCQMEVGTRDDRVVQIRPAADPANQEQGTARLSRSPESGESFAFPSANRGHLCVKGRYAYEFVHAPDRVTTPMLRKDGAWVPVSWDEALDFAAARLKEIAAAHGPDAIGVLGSARATNEENYLIQKFARAVLGTNNVDCCARVCHAPSAKAMQDMLGTGAATNSFDDIERAGAIVLCGCNPTENHPVVGARIKQAVLNGARLIVIDPRRIELAGYAELHLAVRPGHNVELLNAIAAAIIEEGLADPACLAERLEGYAGYERFVRESFAPERVAASCGVPAADIRSAARLYAGTRPAMCFHGLA